ncbi:MAG: TIGR01777 family oxidoreductase [Actinomycetia bacterium]|nr:TIGR01777 family oxidoreductase [Actinomycetes bacterium]
MAEQVERVAVTGATGLVGRAVVAALVARRYEVVVLARDPRQARDTVPGAVDYVAYQQDQDVDDDWRSQLDSVDHVVNLAGQPLFRPLTGRRHLRKATQQRIAGTERLVAAMQAAPRVRTLVNASSVGVYGFGPPSDEEVDEDTAPLPGRYAEGSAAWEAAAAAASPQARVVLLRMGYILTADGGGLPWQLQEARKDKASYFAPGTQWLPWIHLDDVVQFVMSALAEDRWHGAYNVVAPQAVRSREFAHTLIQVVESAPPRQAPAVLARVFVGAGADILLGGRRVTPARLNRAGYKFRHPTLENALAGGRR